MKKLLITVAILSSLAFKLPSQVSLGLKIGVSPEQSPSTGFLLVDRGDIANECLFDLEKITYKPQLGLTARLKNDEFWFTGEILYSQTSVYYSLEYLNRHILPPPGGTSDLKDIEIYKIKKDFIELPISAGVKLGVIEISSGFSISKDLKVENQFEELNGYTTSPSWATVGWHGGIGLNLQSVILELRYHQEFTNYGDNQFIHGQELSLRCPVDRFSAMITVRLL